MSLSETEFPHPWLFPKLQHKLISSQFLGMNFEFSWLPICVLRAWTSVSRICDRLFQLSLSLSFLIRLHVLLYISIVVMFFHPVYNMYVRFFFGCVCLVSFFVIRFFCNPPDLDVFTLIKNKTRMVNTHLISDLNFQQSRF